MGALVIVVYGKEEKEHFLLQQLFDQVAEIPCLFISGLDSDVPCSIVLFGCSDSNVTENKISLRSKDFYHRQYRTMMS